MVLPLEEREEAVPGGLSAEEGHDLGDLILAPRVDDLRVVVPGAVFAFDDGLERPRREVGVLHLALELLEIVEVVIDLRDEVRRVGPEEVSGEGEEGLRPPVDRGDHDRRGVGRVMGVDDGEVVLDLVSAAREDHRDEDLPTVVKRSRRVEVSPGLGDEALEERDEVLILGDLRGGSDDAERVDEAAAPVADHGELVGDS